MNILILFLGWIGCLLAAPIPTTAWSITSDRDTPSAELEELQFKLSRARSQIKDVKSSIIEAFGQGALDEHIDVPLQGSDKEALHYAQFGLENLQMKALDLVGQIQDIEDRGIHSLMPISASLQDFLDRALKSGSDTVQKVTQMAKGLVAHTEESLHPSQQMHHASPISHVKESVLPSFGESFLSAIKWR